MSIKSAFKNNYSGSRVKSYSEIKDINSIKIGCVISGGEGGYGAKMGTFLFGNSGFLWCHVELVAR